MDPEKSSDPWADLAADLGVQSPDESPQPSPATPPPVSTPSPAVSRSTPQRPKSNWSSLASEFGLPVEPEETEAKPTATASHEQGPRATEPEGGEVPPPQPAKSGEPRSEEAGQDEQDLPHRDSPQGREGERKRSRRGGRGRRGGRDAARRDANGGEPAKSASPVSDDALAEAETPAATSPSQDAEKPAEPGFERPAGFAMGNLTLPDWFPFGGRKKKAELSPADQEVPTRDDEVSGEPSDATPPADGDNAGIDRDAVGDDSGSEGGEEKRRGRRRRSRRRGKGSREKADESAHEEEGEASAEEPSVKSAASKPRKRRRDQTVVVTISGDEAILEDDDEDESMDHDDSDDEEGGSPRAPIHKNIPSWADAISCVVDANITARGERKRASRPSSRGGNSQRGGRSRGRRKKSDE